MEDEEDNSTQLIQFPEDDCDFVSELVDSKDIEAVEAGLRDSVQFPFEDKEDVILGMTGECAVYELIVQEDKGISVSDAEVGMDSLGKVDKGSGGESGLELVSVSQGAGIEKDETSVEMEKEETNMKMEKEEAIVDTENEEANVVMVSEEANVAEKEEANATLKEVAKVEMEPKEATLTEKEESFVTEKEESFVTEKEESTVEIEEEANGETEKEEAIAQMEKEEANVRMETKEANVAEKEEAGVEIEKEEAGVEMEKQEADVEMEKVEADLGMEKDKASVPGKEEFRVEMEKEEAEVETEKEEAKVEMEKEEASVLGKDEVKVEMEKEDANVSEREEANMEIVTQEANVVEKEEAIVEMEKEEAEVGMEKEDFNMEIEKEEVNVVEREGAADMGIEKEEANVEMEKEEANVAETVKSGNGGKRKKGKNIKAPAKVPIIGDDVCFICFDGGDLVLCDRRNCPKAYHPSCVNRDEAFFRAKGSWNCGWHLCSKCEKNAHYMCYTCTFSLCKACVREAVILCIRDNKGLCETCMKTVMLIENNGQGNNESQIDFDDKNSWEYLFKDYWTELKAKLSLSPAELAQAKNPYKGLAVLPAKHKSPDEQFDVVKDNADCGADNSSENLDASKSRKRKARKRPTSIIEEEDAASVAVLFDVKDNGDSASDNSSEKLEASEFRKRKAKKRSKSITKEQGTTSEAVQVDVKDDGDSGSDNSSEKPEASKSRKRKAKKRSKSIAKEQDTASEAVASSAEGMATSGSPQWASKELLELVMHMKGGDQTALSQFDVQALLLEYIKAKKLRDPRRKSQIICDTMLQNIFGKARVGHFEMLKLLESHFLMKEDSQVDDVQGSVVDTEVGHLDAAGNTESLTKGGKYKKRKLLKKGDRRGPQFNLDDYAAIDIHNINLIYLRRKLMEDLLENSENFHDKVVETFVRIRITGSSHNHDMYRLVQVVGTSKAAVPYKVGQRMTDIMLEILNLNKTEVIPIDTISNQEFTEDECKRLRQSIKCGLISRLTVGDILDKAMEIQTARVHDWLETEIVRLTHLCDRASETGRKKELRECVEKLQLLKTPEERQRRLEEISQIHADPKMDPSYESEDDESEMDENKREVHMKPRDSAFSRRGKEPISPRGEFYSPKDSWSGNRNSSGNKNWELNRNSSNKNVSNKGAEVTLSFESSPNNNSWNQGRDKDALHSNKLDKSNSAATSSEASPAPLSAPVEETAPKMSETEKMWHYKDPSGKVQGPFSIVQLRKWSNTGYFPVDLKIWRAAGKEEDSFLLTDALAGRFPKEFSQVHSAHPTAIIAPSQHQPSSSGVSVTPSVGVQLAAAGGDSGQSARFSTSSLITPSGSTERIAMGGPSGLIAVPNSEQGILPGPTSSLQTSQSIVVGDPNVNHLVPAPETAANMIQSVNSQNPVSQGWINNAPPQNMDPNAIFQLPGQQPAYAQWGGVPSTNFPTQGVAAFPPMQGNQINMQPQGPPNGQWGMGWGGPVQGNMNMNWGPTFQGGPPPGNPNPGWAMPSGNINPGWVSPPGNPPSGIVQGFVPGNANQAWVNQGPLPGNTNPGWVPPSGNHGANDVKGQQGPPPGNVGATNNFNGPQPGNANQGWGPRGGSRGGGGRGSGRNQRRGRFSGQRDRGSGGGRPWNNRQSRSGQATCEFHESGHCRRGSSCNFPHS